MNFTKVKLNTLTWSFEKRKKRIDYNGHYILDKSKRIRRTENSYNCYLIRTQGIKYKFHIILKRKNGILELKIKCLDNGYLCYLYYLASFEITHKVSSWSDKLEKYFLIQSFPGSSRIFINFSEHKKRKHAKTKSARHLLSKN